MAFNKELTQVGELLWNADSAGGDGEAFELGWFSGLPATLASKGFAGAETGTVQVMVTPSEWADVVLDGTTQVLSVTNNMININASGMYRIKKSATSSPTSVSLTRGN